MSYIEQGCALVFPSGLYHRTCSADDGTIKLSICLRASNIVKTDHAATERRILRSNLRYSQPPNETQVLWGLERYWNETEASSTGMEVEAASDEEAAGVSTSGEKRYRRMKRRKKACRGRTYQYGVCRR